MTSQNLPRRVDQLKAEFTSLSNQVSNIERTLERHGIRPSTLKPTNKYGNAVELMTSIMGQYSTLMANVRLYQAFITQHKLEELHKLIEADLSDGGKVFRLLAELASGEDPSVVELFADLEVATQLRSETKPAEVVAQETPAAATGLAAAYFAAAAKSPTKGAIKRPREEDEDAAAEPAAAGTGAAAGVGEKKAVRFMQQQLLKQVQEQAQQQADKAAKPAATAKRQKQQAQQPKSAEPKPPKSLQGGEEKKSSKNKPRAEFRGGALACFGPDGSDWSLEQLLKFHRIPYSSAEVADEKRRTGQLGQLPPGLERDAAVAKAEEEERQMSERTE